MIDGHPAAGLVDDIANVVDLRVGDFLVLPIPMYYCTACVNLPLICFLLRPFYGACCVLREIHLINSSERDPMGQLFKSVAIFGASGNIGAQLVSHSLNRAKLNVTVITRSSSQAKFPPSISVRKGDYQDAEFLETALRGHDVLLC